MDQKIRDAIASCRAVQAGWAFGVPEDAREQWLTEVVIAVMKVTESNSITVVEHGKRKEYKAPEWTW